MPANPFQSIIDANQNNSGTRFDLLSPRAASIIQADQRAQEARMQGIANQQLQNQAFPTQGGGGSGGGSGPLNNAAERDQMILDETFGFRDQVLNDPTQQIALDFLSGVVGGQNQPFNDEVRSAILTGASDQAANSAANQQQAIIQAAARQGLSPNDPAVQARLNAVTGQQGLAGQQALQNLNQTAGLSNFNASAAAANDLARQRLSQLNLGGQFGMQGVNLLANRNIGQTVAGPQQGVGFGGPSIGPSNVQRGIFTGSAPITFAPPTNGSINVPVSRGGNSNQSNRRIVEVGNSGGNFGGGVPAQQNIGDFNPFGHTAIGPGGF